jgi:hypothetical protein
LPYCRIPSGKHKRQFLGRINRVTAQSKWESLVEAAPFLIKEMKINYVMENETNEVIKVLLKFNSLWNKLFCGLIVLVNLIICVYLTSNLHRILCLYYPLLFLGKSD